MRAWREWRERARAPMDETRAWTCLGMNLAQPGLGTALAGRFVEGALQAVLAVAGALVLLRWFFLFLDEWKHLGHYPWGGGEDLMLWLTGIALFAAGWVWSLVTGLAMVRKHRSR